MRKVIISILLTGVIAACATTENQPTVAIEDDPRIGPEVDRACSIRHIRGWSQVDNDRNALVVNLSHKKSYKLSLVGACQPEWANFAIGIENKIASHCITKHDKLYTDSQDFKGLHCRITKIQEWYPDKLKEQTQESTAPESK
ncbi:DUF6491 family protein [Thalassotalea fusca]